MNEIELHNRDGYHLKLGEIEKDKWELDFGDFPEWGTYRLAKDDGKIRMFDPMGGPCLFIGGKLCTKSGDIKTIMGIEINDGVCIISTEDRV